MNDRENMPISKKTAVGNLHTGEKKTQQQSLRIDEVL